LAEDDVRRLLKHVKSSSLVDAMGRVHRHRCHILDLVTPTPGRVLFGSAVTISYFPSCSKAFDPARFSFARLFCEAVGSEPAGKVLVLASNGHPEASLGGGTKMSRLDNQGLAGVLADGRLRDFEELRRYRFAAYCKGETTRWGGDTVTPFQANVPVVVDGVGVLPGHYIYADAAGAVIIPAEEVAGVVEEAAHIGRDDASSLDQIKTEDPRRIIEGTDP
jgi:4-hydroxy-4-methyl-2-oxoglutarate aldolase